MKGILDLSESQKKALSEWEHILGKERILQGEEVSRAYKRPDPQRRPILGVLFPETVTEVAQIMRVASSHKIPVYPISKGNNYGFGGPSPVVNGCCIIDLARMNKILAMDRNLGLITVEPGVTTGQVQEFLQEQRLPFLGPVIGVGPRASLIGNFLDKGFSSVPYIDRISSLMSLEAVLPDGSLYKSSSLRDKHKPAFYKWGTGPYIDGLFIQSGIGIVTSATFALAPLSETVLGYSLVLKNAEELAQVIDVLREGIHALGDILSSFSLKSPERIMSVGRFGSPVEQGEEDPYELLGEWTLSGFIRGDAAVVRAAKRRLNKRFRQHNLSVFLFSERTLYIVSTFSAVLKLTGVWKRKLFLLPRFHALLRRVQGGPTFFPGVDLEKGFLIIPVVLPMVGETVSSFACEVKDICAAHDHPHTSTISNLSPHAVTYNTMLFFDSENAHERESVHDCYVQMHASAERHGGYVYRASIDMMDTVIDPTHEFWRVAKKIKETFDPLGILAPGRYEKNK